MSDVTSTTSRGPSRRAVVRTAAHAAWAVPAIQIAVAAPAFASSHTGEVALVGGGILTPTTSERKTFKFSDFKVFNSGPQAANVTITAEATVSPKWTSVSAPGWSVSGVGSGTVKLIFTGTVQPVTTAPHEATIAGPTLTAQNANATPTNVSHSFVMTSYVTP